MTTFAPLVEVDAIRPVTNPVIDRSTKSGGLIVDPSIVFENAAVNETLFARGLGEVLTLTETRNGAGEIT